ncbi:hypothetical protein HYS54_03225 [Candidatus Micrarchaeota archaeon]|nr:hypothetical protein [Candidatus Micrarchaeota archaeon]
MAKVSGNSWFVYIVVLLAAAVAVWGAVTGPKYGGEVVQMWLEDYEKEISAGEPASFTLVLQSNASETKRYQMGIMLDGIQKEEGNVSLVPGERLEKRFSVSGVGDGRHQLRVVVFDPSFRSADFGSQQRPYSVSYWLEVS